MPRSRSRSRSPRRRRSKSRDRGERRRRDRDDSRDRKRERVRSRERPVGPKPVLPVPPPAMKYLTEKDTEGKTQVIYLSCLQIIFLFNTSHIIFVIIDTQFCFSYFEICQLEQDTKLF